MNNSGLPLGNLFAGGGGPLGDSMPDFLKDSDNLLILALILMLMKEKANRPLMFALMSMLLS